MTRQKMIGIYLFYSERSGTNLLRQRLTEREPLICSIHPTHILRTLGYWQFNMGALSEEKNWSEIINYALRCCYERAIPWDEKMDCTYVKSEYDKHYADKRSLIRLADIIYQLYANKKGCTSYFCKDLWLFDFANAISMQLPHARFIHLYRDPRDYVASQLKRPFGEQSVIKLSHFWLQECNGGLQAMTDIENNALKFSLGYENFIQNETYYLDEILRHFDLESPAGKERKATSKDDFIKWKNFHEWQNVHRDTMKNNFNKYKKILSNGQINIIESICWNTMRHLGYETESKYRPGLTTYQKKIYPTLISIKKYLRIKINEIRQQNASVNRKTPWPLVSELTKRYR